MKRRVGLSTVLVLTAGLLLGGCRFGMPRANTTEGEEILRLWRLWFVIALFVFTLIYALIAYAVITGVRRRRRSDDLPSQTQYNIPVEIVYVVVPFLLVIGLFVLTIRSERTVDAVSSNPDLLVQVEASQWNWRFRYPETGVEVISTPEAPGELVLPAGATVRFDGNALDVIHSFWVPGFLFKRDLIPGRSTSFEFEMTDPATVQGHCAEFCGLDHARMDFTVRILSPREFEQWMAEQQGTS